MHLLYMYSCCTFTIPRFHTRPTFFIFSEYFKGREDWGSRAHPDIPPIPGHTRRTVRKLKNGINFLLWLIPDLGCFSIKRCALHRRFLLDLPLVMGWRCWRRVSGKICNFFFTILCPLEWDQARERFETLLCDIMGTKPRTITCYSLIGMAVKFIYDANEETFLELGHPWEEMLEDFLPGRFRESIRLTHPEISRPDLLLKNFLRDLASYAKDLTISEVCVCISHRL